MFVKRCPPEPIYGITPVNHLREQTAQMARPKYQTPTYKLRKSTGLARTWSNGRGIWVLRLVLLCWCS
jgi:hypothetical protein